MAYLRTSTNSAGLYVYESIEGVMFNWRGNSATHPVCVEFDDFAEVMEEYSLIGYKGSVIKTTSLIVTPHWDMLDEGDFISLTFPCDNNKTVKIYSVIWKTLVQEYLNDKLKSSFIRRLKFLFNPSQYLI